MILTGQTRVTRVKSLKQNIVNRGRKQQGRLWLLRKSDSDTEVEWVLAESGCNSLVYPLGYIAQGNIIAMQCIERY